MLLVLLTNFGNVMAEFAGIASASELFGIPRLISVPVCAFLVWLLVLKGTYKSVEKVFLVACLFYFAYPITFFILKPDFPEILHAVIQPKTELSAPYLAMVIAVVGTTIAPWMQFYQQASVAEKNISIKDYAYSRLDTIVGCIVVNVVAACIIVVCALTLNRAGVKIESAADAATALVPFAGKASAYLFAFGLWNASLFAASILPLSTSYTICEALGWETGVEKDFETAPQFYVLYTAIIAIGAITILIPGISLIGIMFWSQLINGLLLPVILMMILLLVNDKRLMGEYTNRGFYNVVSWASVILIGIVSAAYVASMFVLN
jgi:Mn2+/Fe2+ NRAMP family transporter